MSKVEQFKQKLSQLYPDTFETILTNMAVEKPVSFRVNTLITSEPEVITDLKALGFEIISGPFSNSYIVIGDKSSELSKTRQFVSGELYIQKIESMIPAFVLEPHEGENILDLCAAPGSKTTQIAIMTNNLSNITAVEIDSLRCQTLKEILSTSQVSSVSVICEDGFRLEQRHPEFNEKFDAVLVDAPCSNESFINPNDNDIPWWTAKRYRDYAGKQKGLLISAYRMLKPGGRLVYSTCTFDIHENEMVIDWLLQRYPEAEISKIDLAIPNSVPGIIEWENKKMHNSVQNCVRILPDKIFNSFFIAKIRKPTHE